MKRNQPYRTRNSERFTQEAEIEMLFAAAEAHPNWEVFSGGIRHSGKEGPDTPEKLLDWFLRKERH
jgi:hypothetical protein